MSSINRFNLSATDHNQSIPNKNPAGFIFRYGSCLKSKMKIRLPRGEILKNLIVIIVFVMTGVSFSFSKEKQEDKLIDFNSFDYDFPVSTNGSLQGFSAAIDYSSLAFTAFRSLSGSVVARFGGSFGYFYNFKNIVKVRAGLGAYLLRESDIHHENYEYREGRVIMNLPISFSVGKKGYDHFGLRIGADATPLFNLYTDHYDSRTNYATGLDSINSFNGREISGGIAFALKPEFVWFSRSAPISTTLTLISPSIILIDPNYFFSLNMGITVDFLSHR